MREQDSQLGLSPAPTNGRQSISFDNVTSDLFVKRRGRQSSVDQVKSRPSISYWQDARMRLLKNKVAMASGVYILLLAVAALVIPEVIPYEYDEQEIWNKHATPTLGSEAVVIDPEKIRYEPITAEISPEGGSSLFDVPPSPAEVSLYGEATTIGVAIKWTQVEGVDGYRIYRSISRDTLGVPLDDVPASSLSYRDNSSLQLGTEYHYFVTAFNAFGDSLDPSSVVVEPRLALSLQDALKIDATATPGSVIMTKPHYLGTDYLGRDMLSRVMMGARISLFIGIGAPLIYILIGILYGSISGYFGGIVDDIMMRITDVVSTVPELLVVIMLQVVMGSGVTTLVIAIVAVAWARSARQVRGEVLRLREMEFVQASKVLGTSFPKIVVRHLLPNVMGTVLVVLTLAIPQTIFTEAFLSFIGLGIAPPMASWGTVTREGAAVFLTYPHELVIPSVLICLTMLAFNLFGDGLRDALDPKMRGAS